MNKFQCKSAFAMMLSNKIDVTDNFIFRTYFQI